MRKLMFLPFLMPLFFFGLKTVSAQVAENCDPALPDSPFYCFLSDSGQDLPAIARAFPILYSSKTWNTVPQDIPFNSYVYANQPWEVEKFESRVLIGFQYGSENARLSGRLRTDGLVLNRVGEFAGDEYISMRVLEVKRIPGYADGWIVFQDGAINKVTIPRNLQGLCSTEKDFQGILQVRCAATDYHYLQDPNERAYSNNTRYLHNTLQPKFNGFVAPPGYGLLLVHAEVDTYRCDTSPYSRDYPIILSTPAHGEAPAQWFFDMEIWKDFPVSHPRCPKSGWFAFAFSDEYPTLNNTWLLFISFPLGLAPNSVLPYTFDLGALAAN